MDFNLTDDEGSKRSTSFDAIEYQIYDVWKHKGAGTTGKQQTNNNQIEILGHDVIMYKLSPISN